MKCPACQRDVDFAGGACPFCQSPLPGSPADSPDLDALSDEVLNLLEDGRKIEAVKRYREVTGQGLREAKDAVEGLEAGRPLTALGSVNPVAGTNAAWEGTVLRLLQEGKKIEAIRIYRETHGCGLKDAKEAVEALGAAHGIVAKGGCLSVIAVVVGVALFAWLMS